MLDDHGRARLIRTTNDGQLQMLARMCTGFPHE